MTSEEPAKRIKRDGPALLWRQVADDLVMRMDAGELVGKLRAEADLADEYKVARVTVRRAIAELVTEGRLEVVRGRGTYIV